MVNAAADIATLGLSTGTGGGYQFLDLKTNTFQSPITAGAASGLISEEIAIDPVRNLILSPTEFGEYEILKTASSSVAKYESSPSPGANFDSAAEDYTTWIGLASDEFTGNLFITDLSQATFTPGSPAGTWSAPN